jgi:5-methylcytosine-specific restriction endonuclease McrBC regulatory subunit McrC
MLDLVCLLLVEATQAVLRQGLVRDYTVHEEPIGALRGRLRVEEQIRRHYGQVDVLECRFDEHEADVLENQVLLAGLAVARRVTAKPEVRARATRLAIALAEVCQPAALRLVRRGARSSITVATATIGWPTTGRCCCSSALGSATCTPQVLVEASCSS